MPGHDSARVKFTDGPQPRRGSGGSQDEDAPVVPQTPESKGIYGAPIGDEITLTGAAASTAGRTTRLARWAGTVPAGESATSSLHVPPAFQ